MQYTRLERAFHTILLAVTNSRDRQYLEQIQEVLVKLTIAIHDKLLEQESCRLTAGR